MEPGKKRRRRDGGVGWCWEINEEARLKAGKITKGFE